MLVDSELSHYMILLLARSLVPAAMGASGTDTSKPVRMLALLPLYLTVHTTQMVLRLSFGST